MTPHKQILRCAIGATLIGLPLWSFGSGLYVQPSSSPLITNHLLTPEKINVGINLGPSGGSIAVDFGNGTVWSDLIHGDEAYREVISRLSLPSSKHLAPPYNEINEGWLDAPRVAARNIRKKLGLPASADVGALSTVVRDLCKHVEKSLALSVQSAAVSVPHIMALYQDDINDILEYVGVEYIHYGRPDLFHEPAAAFSGHGFGLCEHYHNQTRCAEELNELPDYQALVVHYAPNALNFWIGHLGVSPGERGQSREDFSLGSDFQYYPDGTINESYWLDVEIQIEELIGSFAWQLPVSMLMFVGESTPTSPSDRLLGHILHNLDLYQVEPSFILLGNDRFVAARGTAEVAKRRTPDHLDLQSLEL